MTAADVIIGSNFGDEGKGLITDFLCARDGTDTVVVRFNGGAQAGHTVVDNDGRRHVFSHFGSGSFVGAGTFLSRFFVSNPLLFVREFDLLKQKSVTSVVQVDGASPVTTPYDMMINQIAEESRGTKRHGSCGVGFGETLERHEKSPHTIFYRDLKSKEAIKEKLRVIRQEWLPQRLAALGVADISGVWKERINGTGVEEKFLQDAEFFLDHSNEASALPAKKIVFEGAQGLLLDQDSGYFPHVTRSNTGLKNVLTLSKESGIDTLNVVYITRAYATRHGAGPLAHELPQPPYRKIEDETNVLNPYQGHLRFGWLDAGLLVRTIKKDLQYVEPSVQLNHGLAVTCLDQVDDKVSFIDGDLRESARDAYPQYLREKTGASFLYCSNGPQRKDVSAH